MMRKINFFLLVWAIAHSVALAENLSQQLNRCRNKIKSYFKEIAPTRILGVTSITLTTNIKNLGQLDFGFKIKKTPPLLLSFEGRLNFSNQARPEEIKGFYQCIHHTTFLSGDWGNKTILAEDGWYQYEESSNFATYPIRFFSKQELPVIGWLMMWTELKSGIFIAPGSTILIDEVISDFYSGKVAFFQQSYSLTGPKKVFDGENLVLLHTDDKSKSFAWKTNKTWYKLLTSDPPKKKKFLSRFRAHVRIPVVSQKIFENFYNITDNHQLLFFSKGHSKKFDVKQENVDFITQHISRPPKK